MRVANVPPPMALHELTLESNIVDVAISTDYTEPDAIILAVLHHAGCSLYEWPIALIGKTPPTQKWTFNVDQRGKAESSMYLQVASSSGATSTSCILLLSSDSEASKISILGKYGALLGSLSSRDRSIEGIVTNGPCSENETYLCIDNDYGIDSEALESGIAEVNEQHDLKLAVVTPSSVPGRDAIRCGSHDTMGIIFSSTENSSLFANDRRLTRNCTSFLVTPAHLIFTTSQNLLKFVHMTEVAGGTSFKTRIPTYDLADHSRKILMYHRIHPRRTNGVEALRGERSL